MRLVKIMVAAALLLMLVPLAGASATTGLEYEVYTNAVKLRWAKQPSENSFMIFVNGYHAGTTTGSTFTVSGLQACTNYGISVYSGVGSTQYASVKTGCGDKVLTFGATGGGTTTFTASVTNASFQTITLRAELWLNTGYYGPSIVNTRTITVDPNTTGQNVTALFGLNGYGGYSVKLSCVSHPGLQSWGVASGSLVFANN